MCGIAGFISIENGTAGGITDQLVESLLHRGPDGTGTFVSEKDGAQVVLAHTRLAILDLSQSGNQPMQDPITGHVLVFNGEIYNFRELRNEIGGHWNSQSDTEVILRGYARWGTGILRRLRGMFAIAIWDNAARKLLLARDPYGIKPLYYYAGAGTFLFASETRTLVTTGLVPGRLSSAGLHSFLQYGSVQTPLTLIDGVLSLKPGCFLQVAIEDGKIQQSDDSFVAADTEERLYFEGNRQQAIEKLRVTLEDSVLAHLLSDVPVGAFLSGGIDSSAIVALASRVAANPLNTFSVIFLEKEFSEALYSQQIARVFHTHHTEILVTEQEALPLAEKALAIMDQPTMDGINTYVVSQAVRNVGMKVALSGLGGDELFAGYPAFRRATQLQNASFLPRFLRKRISAAAGAVIPRSVQQRKLQRLISGNCTPFEVYSISRELFDDQEIYGLTDRHLDSPSVRRNMSQDPVNAISRMELGGYMLNTLLRDTDQMSMAHALEVRVPFIDQDVVSLVLSMPGSWKLNGRRPKPLLLDALGDLLPKETTHRKKMGFTLPFERWMHTSLKRQLSEMFADTEALRNAGLTQFAQRIWNNFLGNPRAERWSRAWSLYVLANWCQRNSITPV